MILISESYAFGGPGSEECLQGDFILDQNSCKDACEALNLPQADIAGENKCYMNSDGHCKQDGLHNLSWGYIDSSKAMMICIINENTSRKYTKNIYCILTPYLKNNNYRNRKISTVFFSVNSSNPIDVTISKKGVNVCLGNSADFCDSTWLSYPNLNAALFGIDMPSLNPVPNDFISEPGVKAQIFQGTFTDETGRMAQYDFLQTIDDLRCAGKFEEYLFTSFEDTIETWDSFEQTGMNFQWGLELDVSVEYKGVGASTTIPPMFTRSTSKSNEAAGMEKHFYEEHGSVAHSRAECSIYRVLIDIDDPSLKFYSGFEYALLHIDAVMRNGATENKKKEVGIWFVEKYGTHYSKSSQMGSSIAFETRYNESETIDHDHNLLKECNTRTGAKVFWLKVEEDLNGCEGSLEDTTKGNDTSVKRTTQTTIGSFPAESANISGWSEQLQEMAGQGKTHQNLFQGNQFSFIGEDKIFQTSRSTHSSFSGTLNPSPIRRELVPILKLFETEAMMNIAHSSGPYKDQKINITNIAEVVVPMRTKTIVLKCREQIAI